MSKTDAALSAAALLKRPSQTAISKDNFLSIIESSAGPVTYVFSLWALIQGGAWVLVTLIAAVWLSGSIERKLMRAPIDSNLRIVLARLSKVALMFLALMVTLPLVGIDLTALSVFGGALGVGLGFGLQKIVGNFISGIILLADKSVKPGDLVPGQAEDTRKDLVRMLAE